MKEQQNKYTQRSKRRGAQQLQSCQTNRMKIKFRYLQKQHNDMLNGMSNIMYEFLDDFVDNRNKIKVAS